MTAPIYEDTLEDRQFATTLARGLEILRCFTPEEPFLGNKELAERTGLPRPTISRFTYTLVRLGYLRHAMHSSKYQLGSAVVSLGYPMLARVRLRQVVRPAMNELADLLGCSVSMGVRDRLGIVYVETSRSRAVFAPQFSDIGRWLPIASSSMGHAYLVACDRAERESLLNEVRVKMPDLFKDYHRSIDRSLREFPRTGCCILQKHMDPAVRAVAVPLKRPVDGERLVFNCVSNVKQLRKGMLENEIGPRLVAMVKSLELALKNG
ncbi:IclR family transcriptional regulator [Ramlibacter sp.]|uniref:IclR family transcriptional regulator n=1 Tax=Ramlibacter sp. TaxID=1917967 RepID=UPI003D0AED4B